MSCNEYQAQLNEALQPEQVLAPQLEAHLASCPACQALRRELMDLRANLQQLPPPALPLGFQMDLRRKLVEQRNVPVAAPARATRRWVVPSLIAAAAALALVVVGSFLSQDQLVAPSAPRSFQQLSLTVHSATDYPDARFTINLPSGVELADEAGNELRQGRSLRWSSRLRAGINEIDLPLVVGPQPGPVLATLTIDGKTYHSRVDLEPAPSQAGASLGSRRLQLAWNLTAQRPDGVVLQGRISEQHVEEVTR